MGATATFDTVRKIALTLPEVTESTTYGTPSFKVRGQLLTCMAINKSAEPGSLAVRVDMDQRDHLLTEAPDVYYVTDHYVNYPVVLVRLSHVDAGTLRDLLGMAWKFVTTKNPKPKSKPRKVARRVTTRKR